MEIKVTPRDNLQQICDNAKRGDVILLGNGIFRQKIVVSTPQLSFYGSGSDLTIIEFDDFAKKIHADGNEYNTFRTFTVAVCADYVSMKNLTIKNSTKNPKENGQCVALSVVADNFKMENCKLISTQDTLFCGPLPDDLICRYLDFLPDNLQLFEGGAKQEFSNCEIYGSVDFVFGCGNAVFKNCKLISVCDGRETGFVAAPAHSLKQKKGFVFSHCVFEASDGVANRSVFLARPWREFGKCEFIRCRFGSHINPLGFDKWNDTNRDRTARFSVKDCTKLSKLVEWAKLR